MDFLSSIFIDNNNNIYLVGSTNSWDLPVYNLDGSEPFYNSRVYLEDAYIIKFNSKGEILWATYYVGNLGDGASSIYIDSHNNIYVAGSTNSSDFLIRDPGGSAFFQENIADGSDAFILKFIDKKSEK